MAIIKPNDYFKVSGSTWTWPTAAYDNNYGNYVRMGSGASFYYYKVGLTSQQAENMQVHIYFFSAAPLCTYYLAYGDNNSQTVITQTQVSSNNHDFIVPFSLSETQKNLLKQHSQELLIGIQRNTTSWENGLAEIDIEVPDFISKIHVGEKNAAAVYVGNTKETAVYIGTIKIL